MESVKTDYGNVPLNEVIRVYNNWKKANNQHLERRRAFLDTEEGRKYNCEKAKEYYQRHKETVLAKAKARYEAKKAAQQN